METIMRIFLAKCRAEGIPLEFIVENKAMLSEIIRQSALEFKAKYLISQSTRFVAEIDYTESLGEMAVKNKIELDSEIDGNTIFETDLEQQKKILIIFPFKRLDTSLPLGCTIETLFSGKIKSAGIEHLFKLRGEDISKERPIVAPAVIYQDPVYGHKVPVFYTEKIEKDGKIITRSVIGLKPVQSIQIAKILGVME